MFWQIVWGFFRDGSSDWLVACPYQLTNLSEGHAVQWLSLIFSHSGPFPLPVLPSPPVWSSVSFSLLAALLSFPPACVPLSSPHCFPLTQPVSSGLLLSPLDLSAAPLSVSEPVAVLPRLVVFLPPHVLCYWLTWLHISPLFSVHTSCFSFTHVSTSFPLLSVLFAFIPWWKSGS